MRRTGAKGQALVEFAVVVPLLMLLILGLFEFGRIYNAKLVVTQAVREGARRAVVMTGTTQAAKETAAKAQAVTSTQDYANNVGIAITVNTPTLVTVSGDANKAIVVSAYYDVPLVIPTLGTILGTGANVRVTSTAEMRME